MYFVHDNIFSGRDNRDWFPLRSALLSRTDKLRGGVFKMRTHFSLCVHLVALCVVITWSVADAVAEVRNPNGFAVIVGNKKYKHHDIPEVSFAHRDAAAFKRYVVDVLGFDPKNIIYLHDATRAKLFRTLGYPKRKKSALWAKLFTDRKWDVVVFYSGHGVPGRNDGRGYLLPVDVTPDAAQEEGYPIDLLYKKLGSLTEARSVQVYLDACFSGGSAEGPLVKYASAADRRLVLPKDSMGKVTRVTAAGAGQIASWDKTAGHGLFTHYLLNALYGKADTNGDKKVTAKEAKIYLDAYMTRAAYSEYERDQDADVESAEGAVLASAPPGGFPERPTLALKAPVAKVTKFEIAISTTPIDAKIYFPDLNSDYQRGLALEKGTHRVRISRKGYKVIERNIRVPSTESSLHYTLERDCRTVQVPQRECREVNRYREEEKTRPSRRSVKTTFKIGPHYGFQSTACKEGKSKIKIKLRNECNSDEALERAEAYCRTCDRRNCYLRASGYCVGEKNYTKRTPYKDEQCETTQVDKLQCAPL